MIPCILHIDVFVYVFIKLNYTSLLFGHKIILQSRK